jgi:hypothetical protein
MWDFSLEAAHEQCNNGDYFGIEHPGSATSWKLTSTQELLQREDVALMTFDMCSFGLSVVSSGELSQKTTKIATINPWLAYELFLAQCDRQHSHRLLIGGLPHLAQEYPPALCETIARCAQSAALHLPTPSFMMMENEMDHFHGFGETEEDQDADLEVDDTEQAIPTHKKRVTEAQQRLVQKLHVNLGHPPRDRLLRALRSAGALPHVLDYVQKEHECDDCRMKHRPDVRRKAQLPRTFSFNKIVGVDFFYIHWQNWNLAIMNIIDLGTSYQIAVRAGVADGTSGGTPTSQTAWSLFLTTWVRFYGARQMVICDAGNEFRGAFERGLEHMGIFQHTIHPESPWENGLTERHGGWVKDRLDREINSGRSVVQVLSDLDELLSNLTSAKNNWLNKGGYTPSQLVFGQLTRVPGELLAEDDLATHGMQDAFSDPLEVDEAAGEYRRRFQIRERARQLALRQESREALRGATRAATHQNRTWSPGQWVYVFRRGRANQELHLRDRWVGPGLVVLANNGTVFVGMRSRLWRCSSEQLRPALPSEILGKDLASDPGLALLLRKVISGARAGAIDVVKEGPPPDHARLLAVEPAEEGVQLSDEMIQAGPINDPEPPVPVPVGILPSGSPTPIPQEPETPVPQHGDSRRPSTHEPASEPDEATPTLPPGLSQAPPGLGLEVIPETEDEPTPVLPESSRASTRPAPACESDDPEPPVEPPPKVPRVQNEPDVVEVASSNDASILSPSSSDSSGPVSHIPSQAAAASSTSAASAQTGSRAPGTPVRSLLDRVPRLTPAELLPSEAGRVNTQIQEVERLRQAYDELQENHRRDFSSQGWSGNYFNYSLGSEALRLEQNGTWSLMAKRNDEISLKELNQDEMKMFEASDRLEWEAILKTGAVRVVTGNEAAKLRAQFPDRIISSRMVRRKKPLPELHKWKAKSRWCIHGHKDPDTGTLVTYAPTPQSEGMMMFLQVGLNYEMKFGFSDVSNAFCQSNRLRRPRGPLFAEPCEGLNLPPGSLIIIDVPVYGLDDAPASWRATVTDFLVEDIGCERNLVEPCWFSKFHPKTGELMAQVLVEVDDFIVAAVPSYYGELKNIMQKRFNFGKWQEDEAEYAGRHIRCQADTILIDQNKYIQEQIHPIQLVKGRRQATDRNLSTEEFNSLRSLIYKINWVARESRPEAAGLASIMASKLKEAKIDDILTVNKFVNFLRSTAERPLKIWRFDPSAMCFIVCSDAGGINTKGLELQDEDGLPTDATQGAWIVLTAERLPCGRQRVRASPMAWRSSKLKRKVFSTYGGETQAMLQGVNEVDWLQIMYRDATAHDVQLKNWRNSLSPHMLVMPGECVLGGRQQQCSVTDAKSLYDCLLREHPTGKQDRKSALELSIVLKDLQETKSMVRWVPHQKMLVDCLTKEDPLRANDALNQFLRSGVLSLVDIEQELESRRVDPSFRRRSHAASRERLIEEYQSNYVQWISPLVNYIWGSCDSLPDVNTFSFDQGFPIN